VTSPAGEIRGQIGGAGNGYGGGSHGQIGGFGQGRGNDDAGQIGGFGHGRGGGNHGQIGGNGWGHRDDHGGQIGGRGPGRGADNGGDSCVTAGATTGYRARVTYRNVRTSSGRRGAIRVQIGGMGHGHGGMSGAQGCVPGGPPATGADNYQQRIALPVPFNPEGIAIYGDTFFAGSTVNGSIWAGDLKTGEGSFLVQPAADRMAYGIFPDNNGRLWVAGGSTGKAFVYDRKTGELLAEYLLEPGATKRINDVYVTRDAAYFTCGSVVCTGATAVYRVAIGAGGHLADPAAPGVVQKIQLDIPVRSGMEGARDGLNGIRGWNNDRQLILGQTGTGKLWALNLADYSVREIALNEPVPTNDGMIVDGKTVYSVSNQAAGYIAVIRMADDLSSGTVVTHLDNGGSLANSATAALLSTQSKTTSNKIIYVLARDSANPTAPVAVVRVDVPKNIG